MYMFCFSDENVSSTQCAAMDVKQNGIYMYLIDILSIEARFSWKKIFVKAFRIGSIHPEMC